MGEVRWVAGSESYDSKTARRARAGESTYRTYQAKKNPAEAEGVGGDTTSGLAGYSDPGGLFSVISFGGKDALGNKKTLSHFRP
jgi:hypothetical protein